MPVYEYVCRKCSYAFSQFFTGFNTDEKQCPQCGEKNDLLKKISAPSVTTKSCSSSSSCSDCSSKNCGSCGS